LVESDELLVIRLKKADRDAAGLLVDRFHEPLFLFLRRLGHDTSTSEDLTQETFVKAWTKINSLDSSKSLKSWLYRIAVNASRDYYRRNRRLTMLSENFDAAADQENALEALTLSDEMNRVRKAVESLPKKFKQIVLLHYMQHLSLADAAEALGVRAGTAKSRLARALKMLRENMVGR